MSSSVRARRRRRRRSAARAARRRSSAASGSRGPGAGSARAVRAASDRTAASANALAAARARPAWTVRVTSVPNWATPAGVAARRYPVGGLRRRTRRRRVGGLRRGAARRPPRRRRPRRASRARAAPRRALELVAVLGEQLGDLGRGRRRRCAGPPRRPSAASRSEASRGARQQRPLAVATGARRPGRPRRSCPSARPSRARSR